MKPGDLVQQFIFKYLLNKLGIFLNFSYIPAGTFTMGSPTTDLESQGNERPEHRVTITKPFLMLRTPVTQELWEAIMGSNPSSFTGDTILPVEQVSWYDAVDFCNALSKQAGLPPAYIVNGNDVRRIEKSIGYRLPTEAEWEYACRAGSTTSRYGPLDRIAWHDGNSYGQTHPVGQKDPNAWNLYDMLGNVWEWVYDWNGPYSVSMQINPQGPASGSSRVFRGGSWFSVASLARTGYRDSNTPVYLNYNVGFRICRNLA